MSDTKHWKLLSYLTHAHGPDRDLDREIHEAFRLDDAQVPQYTASTAACASLIERKLPGLNYAFSEEGIDRISVTAWFGYPMKNAVTAVGNGIALALCGALVLAAAQARG